jgi:hypothetical protein
VFVSFVAFVVCYADRGTETKKEQARKHREARELIKHVSPVAGVPVVNPYPSASKGMLGLSFFTPLIDASRMHASLLCRPHRGG